MKIPDRWSINDTGGGFTALERPLAASPLCEDYWCITDAGDPSAPTNPESPCCLGLYVDGSAILQWHCSCLAEALAIADGATFCA